MSSPPFKVKAVYEYTSPHEDDLHFSAGQVITVVEEEDEEWYVGQYLDASGVKQEGIFPRNFVEKYEPTAPPRPNRTSRSRKEAEPMSPGDVQQAPLGSMPETQREPEPDVEPLQMPPAATEPSSSASKAQIEAPLILPGFPASTVSKPPSSKSSAPPPVSEKLSGGSFRERIAAFNKTAPPPAPFKPSGLGSGGSSSFIKKQFVAPPPSKNAYVPTTPREFQAHKVYRREEDPEIAARQSEDLEQAERAGLAPSQDEGEEEQPKPTSLKERIALLQKQQMEQDARHADAAQKKEKPKKPVKKKPDAHPQEGTDDGETVVSERPVTEGAIDRTLTNPMVKESVVPLRRKSLKGPTTTEFQPSKSSDDGNEADVSGAGDTTGEVEEPTGRDENYDSKSKAPPARQPDVGEEEGATEEAEEDEDEEEDVDPEIRRKEELRARMAKMSGGMGMHGMFGGGMSMASAPPKRNKSTSGGEKRPAGVDDSTLASARAPPVPMPGMSTLRSHEEMAEADEYTPVTSSRPSYEIPDVEDVVPQERSAPLPAPPHETSDVPAVARGRPAPPPTFKDLYHTAPASRSGSDSDDEKLNMGQKMNLPSPSNETPKAPQRPSDSTGTPISLVRRSSYFTSEEAPPSSPSSPDVSKRSNRIPPIPVASPDNNPQFGASLSPAPSGPPSRSQNGNVRMSTSSRHATEEVEEEEVTEYEGDYDTDIASATPHKEALKSHPKLSHDNFVQPLVTQSSAMSPSRNLPPPLPLQPPPGASSDVPRAAPPPPPSGKMPAQRQGGDDEYDPYKYVPPPAAPSKPSPKQPSTQHSVPLPRSEADEDDLYSASPPRAHTMPTQDWGVPQPPPREHAPLKRAPPRQSLDASRSATSGGRRSLELGRRSMDSGFVANDVDLGHGSSWWTKPKGMPPSLHNRKDILFESEESTMTRSNQDIIAKDLFVLYTDYSQTVITARYDAKSVLDVKLEQRHEQPPPRLRQDQLEQAYEQFSQHLFEAVSSKKETVVGDGTAQGLIQELLKPFPDALHPVGTRAYGALVYANLANASTQQNDEIRAGDIITLRNAKFQGKHGAMHAKYSVEVGKPDHVGIVAEWDGTKKKVRAWEQGRESKKIKLESFKLDDLRSGEVKVWRVMPRSWVGWSGTN